MSLIIFSGLLTYDDRSPNCVTLFLVFCYKSVFTFKNIQNGFNINKKYILYKFKQQLQFCGFSLLEFYKKCIYDMLKDKNVVVYMSDKVF